MRKLLVTALLGGGALVAVAARRRQAARTERVDVYFEDGSMVSVVEGAPGADRLLPVARDALRLAATP